MPGAQGENSDDQFRRVAEGCVQDPTHGWAGVSGKRFGGLAHHSCQRNDADCGRDKNSERRSVGKMQADSHWDRQQQHVQPQVLGFERKLGPPARNFTALSPLFRHGPTL